MADDPIEDLFRQRLQHHEEAPPANGWQRIHHTLQQPEKKPFAFWRWLSLALLPVATTVLVVKNLPEGSLMPASENTPASSPSATTPQASNRNLNTSSSGSGTTTDSSNNQLAPSTQTGNPSQADAAATEVTAPAPVTEKTTNTANTKNGHAANTTGQANSGTLVSGNQTQTTAAGSLTAKLTPAKRSENSLAFSGAKPKARKAKTGISAKTGITAAASAQAKPNQLALAQQKQNTLPAENTKPADQEESDQAAAPNTGKATAPNQAKTGNSLPSNPTGGAPLGGGTGAAAGTSVPKAPASGNAGSASNPNPPTLSDSLTETEAKNAERLLAGNILVDPVLAATKVDAKKPVLAQNQENQERKADESSNRNWHFGASLGTRYGLRRFTPSTTDEVHIQQLSDKNKTYPARLDYEAGAIAQRQLSDKFALEAGLGALYFREQVEFKAATAPSAAPSLTQTDNTITYLPTYHYETVKNSTTAWYATTRIGAVYSALGSGNTRLQLTAGATASYLMSHKTTSSSSEPGLAKPEPVKVQAGGYAGLRLLQKFPSGASVALEPGFTYYATPWQKQAAPYSLRSHAATVNLIFFLK